MSCGTRLFSWAAVGLCLPLVACGYTSGLIRDSMTSVQLSKDNFEYLAKGVSASANVHSIFCVIPLQDAPYKRIMEELHAKAGLAPNESFVNFREDYVFRLIFGVWCIGKYTLSADVIRFRPEGSPVPGTVTMTYQSITPPAPAGPQARQDMAPSTGATAQPDRTATKMDDKALARKIATGSLSAADVETTCARFVAAVVSGSGLKSLEPDDIHGRCVAAFSRSRGKPFRECLRRAFNGTINLEGCKAVL